VGTAAAGFVPGMAGDALLYAPDLGASGVIGNPHAASATSGAAFLEACSVALAGLLEGDGAA
jgi:hypothetical protein